VLTTLQALLDRTWLRATLTDLHIDVAGTRRAVLELPTRLQRRETLIMSNLDDLRAAVDRNGQAVAAAVGGITDLRAKVANLQRAVDENTLDPDQLARVVASIDASTDSIAQALAPVVEDPTTPTEEPGTGAPLDPPPAQNPDTSDPAQEGAVPAGQPLPTELLA